MEKDYGGCLEPCGYTHNRAVLQHIVLTFSEARSLHVIHRQGAVSGKFAKAVLFPSVPAPSERRPRGRSTAPSTLRHPRRPYVRHGTTGLFFAQQHLPGEHRINHHRQAEASFMPSCERAPMMVECNRSYLKRDEKENVEATMTGGFSAICG